MADTLRTTFANTETAAKFEYNGNWIANGKEKRISWPGTYDGLFCEMPPDVAEKLLAAKYPGLRAKSGKTEKQTKDDLK
jgi:hypothetical protein